MPRSYINFNHDHMSKNLIPCTVPQLIPVLSYAAPGTGIEISYTARRKRLCLLFFLGCLIYVTGVLHFLGMMRKRLCRRASYTRHTRNLINIKLSTDNAKMLSSPPIYMNSGVACAQGKKRPARLFKIEAVYIFY